MKPESPVKALGADIVALVTRPKLIINALPVFAAMVFFNKAMIELKPAIPAINPFSWDVAFMAWDRALHFGLDPWVILQPALGYDYVTFAINLAYNFWFIALFSAWFWFGFRKEADELRTRFFLSYMLAWWIGGGLLAVIFSSAGPVYFDELGLLPNPYTELFAYLNDADTRIPLWFLDTQQMLWDGHTGKGPAFGISAMPSMHNASAVLFALAFAQVSRKLGWFFAAYAVVILIGSVHLGWHYAIDGYAGAVIALFSWWLAGIAARWFAARPLTGDTTKVWLRFDGRLRWARSIRKPPRVPSMSVYDLNLDKNPANYQPLTPLSFLARSAAVYPEQTAIIHGRRGRTMPSSMRAAGSSPRRCRRRGSGRATRCRCCSPTRRRCSNATMACR